MKKYRMLVWFISLSSFVLSQPNFSFPDTPNQAPIGGLGFLAAAGGAMALKKLHDKYKK